VCVDLTAPGPTWPHLHEPWPSPLTVDELTEVLLTAGRLDTPTRRATTYLLSQTELVHRTGFRTLVELSQERDHDGNSVIAAYTDWKQLHEQLDEFRLSGGDARLVRLALSYAAGIPVDLRDASAGHGSVHIRHVIEAAIMATGAEDAELYQLAEGPGFERMCEFQRGLGIES
jgi:hypothetical protein